MRSRDDELRWIPLWIDKWLFGSTRIELQPDERSVWLDLMVLAAKDRGFIQANSGVPYPLAQLAGLFCVSQELLERTINRCLAVGKLIENGDHTYFLPSWQEYKLSPRHKRRFVQEKEHMSPKEDTVSPKEDAIVEEKIGNEKEKKEEGLSSEIIFVCDFFEITRSIHEELAQEFSAVDLMDVYIRLRNGCKDGAFKYKTNVYGHIKNLRNTLRNWCLRAKPVPGNPASVPKSEPAKVKCHICGVVYSVKDGHECQWP